MAQWARRGRGRRKVRWEVVWRDDGQTAASAVGDGVRCDQPVAASAELAPCAAVVVETPVEEERTAGEQAP